MRANPRSLEHHVRTLCETFGPRDAGHPGNMARVAEHVRDALARARAEVSMQSFEAAGERYRNVIARLGPDTRERVIVGAHYDTHGPWPGADDNASGVAVLMELAGCLAEARLGCTVELVAYALEELPFFGTERMGSAVHAASLREADLEVRVMIGLEMVGYFDDRRGSQDYPVPLLRPFYPSRGNFIGLVGRLFRDPQIGPMRRAMRRATALPVRSIRAPRTLPGVDLSDHRNYWAAGWDAVMVTDTAFYRNPNYHTPFDTPDTLDYGRMAQVVDGLAAAVIALAR